MKKFIQTLAIFAGIVTLLLSQACTDNDSNDDMMELHQERLEIGRALLEVQAPNVADVLPYYTDDIEYHDPIVDINGIADMTAFLNQLIIGASPNLVTIVEDETLLGDTYSATWTMSGDFLEVPYQAKGISIFKFMPNSSQVYYQRDYYSEGDIMATIPGLDEAIGGFRMYYRCSVDPTFDCPIPPVPPSAISGLKSSQAEISDDQLTVGRQLVEINAANWMNVLPYLENDYDYHDPIVDIYGPDTMAMFLGRLFAGSSDLYTTVEDETIVDDIYMATWTMEGEFNGAPFSAPGMSIVKFIEGTTQTYYSRDYYTEGDVMLGVPELSEAVVGFRHYYRSAVDPGYETPQ
nr:nuclear transport factor 2 family protein [uncultured Draconibacterium sp.]